MDFLNNLPTDNSNVSDEMMNLAKRLLPAHTAGSIEMFSAHKFDEVFDELKFSIIIALVAILIYSPFTDKLFNAVGLKSVSAILIKTAIFITIHYILLRKMYK
jgi:uncharacterized membrane protein YjjP (DUF1212 family)